MALKVEIQIQASVHVLSAFYLCHKCEVVLAFKENSRMLPGGNITLEGEFEVYRQRGCTVENQIQRGLI